MRRCLSWLLAAVATPALAQGSGAPIACSATDILKLPRDMYLGEVAGVATNSKGDIYVHVRNGNPTASLGGARAFAFYGSQLLQFDSTGKFLREIGKGAYGFMVAQQVRVDLQDNVWVVDSYSGMVMEFDPAGRMAMLLGRKPEEIRVPESPPPAPRNGAAPGAGQPQDVFSRPSDVAWDARGNIFVADGIGNNTRIAKFDKDGVFVKSWGAKGSGNGEFADVHSLAIDAAGNVYAADAGNKHIQVFDNDGTFLRQIGNVGAPAALCLSGGAHPYLYSSNSNPVNDIDSGGEITKLELDGTIVGRFGRAGKLPGEFGTVNAIDCRRPNQLFVAEIGNYRIQKLTLR